MNIIRFPKDYNKALQEKTKNTTVRIGNEMGKYAVGETYHAKSYDNEDFGIDILIKEIQEITIDNLSDFGVPEDEIKRIRQEGGGGLVEFIRFEVVD